MSKKLNIAETYFRMVKKPKKNKVYYQFDKGLGYPVMIIDGAYFRNDRLSNFWTWRNILTGEKQTGYGCFYELLKLENGQTMERHEEE